MALTLTESLADEWMKAAADERQQLFFEYLPKTLELWGLQGKDGWVMSVQQDGDNDVECFPLWTHNMLALRWAAKHHPDCEPSKISLNEFKTTWLPGLEKNGIKLLISPSDSAEDCVSMTSKEFFDGLQG